MPKISLQVELSSRRAETTDVLVIDGSALLWVIHWPADSVIQEYVSNVEQRIQKRSQDYDVYLVFDVYLDFSTKPVTRGASEVRTTRVLLKLKTTLPSKKVAKTVIEYKMQLIQIIFEELWKARFFTQITHTSKVIITGEKNYHVEIENEEIRMRNHPATNHEEIDNIIVQQVLWYSLEGKSITVMSDDTDIWQHRCLRTPGILLCSS